MKKVLTIGPDYRTLKGGIASVLEVYAKYDKTFTFLPTYSSENNFKNILLFPLNYFKIFWFLLTKPEYKMVHIHGASRISFYRKYIIFLTVKYLLGRKTTYHVHGAEYHLFVEESNILTKALIRHMINSNDAIICLSTQWKEFFEKNFNNNNIYILNNTISMPIENIKDEVNSQLVYLLLGRIDNRKGIFDLIDVIVKHKTFFENNIKVLIGGDGEIKRLENQIKQYQLGEIVEFIGWVSGSKKDELLMSSDVYILPSYNEGLPISILEAMSYKMPIISTDVGGIPTIVKEDVNGKVIKPGDQNALFESMKYFMDRPENIKVFGEKSFEMVQDFLPEKVIHDLHEIYRKIQ